MDHQRLATITLAVLALLLSSCSTSGDPRTETTDPEPTATPAPTPLPNETALPNETPLPNETEETVTTSTTEPAEETGDGLYPDVVDVAVTASGDRTFNFATTLSSPYDSRERYADAWRVSAPDRSVVYGVRELAHDHAGEQPFTRSLSGVEIPASVTEVLVEGRDQVNGWGGATMLVDLP